MNRSPHRFLQNQAQAKGCPYEPHQEPGPRYQTRTKLVQRKTGRRLASWIDRRYKWRGLPWRDVTP